MDRLNDKKYAFLTDDITFSIEKKSDTTRYLITGYIATSDRDIVNDIVTDEAMKNMLEQLKDRPITMDVEHEVFIKKNHSIIPVAKIVEAKRDDKGIWIKAEFNKHNSKFKEVWNSVKDKFLTAFSIAYKPVKYIHQIIDGVKTRLLQQVVLLNVTLTGVPINSEARIDAVMMKSLIELDEVNNMADEPKKQEKVEETKEEPVKEETKKEAVVEKKDMTAELKSFFDSKFKETEKKIENMQAELKSLFEKLEKPMLKALNTNSMDPKGETDVNEEKVEETKAEPAKEVKQVNPLDML